MADVVLKSTETCQNRTKIHSFGMFLYFDPTRVLHNTMPFLSFIFMFWHCYVNRFNYLCIQYQCFQDFNNDRKKGRKTKAFTRL